MGIPTPVPPSDEAKSALVERIIRGELTPEQAQQRHGLSRAELKEWVRIYRREARRAFDDRVKSVLSHQGIDMDELSGAEFSGNVEDMAVAELLQTIQLGGKDAEIHIDQGPRRSHLWCVGGDVVDAETAELRGAPAVYRMLAFQSGRIHADFSPVDRSRRIDSSTAALLMEGARRFDECRRLRAELDEMDAVFVPSDRSLAPDVKATPEQFAVLRLFDGFRTCDEVVDVSPAPDLETLTSIIALRDGGLLERVRPSRTSLREIPISVISTETPASSFSPIAQSVGVPAPTATRPRPWVWGVAAVGAATLGAAFALRLSDEREARQRAAETPEPPRAAAPSAPRASFGVPGAPGARNAPSSSDRTTPHHTQPDRAASAAPNAFALCPEGSVSIAADAPAVAPFCLGRTEVTVAEYEHCRERGACSAAVLGGDAPEARLSPELRPHAQDVYASQCNAGQDGRARHPINCVTYQQANAYCTAAGGRLPTEAEWDLAARGSEQRAFPWGDAPPDATRLNACGSECKAWYGELQLDSVFDGIMYDADDGFAGTAPVGNYAAGATRDGVYDLLGNVAEWTATAVDFGQAREAAPAGGAYVVRGGSFVSGLDGEGRPASRSYLAADARGRGVGFRCAWAPKPLR
ncbi:MAG TPA: SUMF1/EgtB/PvdO family nonheme iron enzyme [Polyangiaceae bacterium]|nr:SUMF1/EgtB/PvdO family nonheme iron enzyme [Polyangiaceae bacterium]